MDKPTNPLALRSYSVSREKRKCDCEWCVSGPRRPGRMTVNYQPDGKTRIRSFI
jgi:hypothetical protein